MGAGIVSRTAVAQPTRPANGRQLIVVKMMRRLMSKIESGRGGLPPLSRTVTGRSTQVSLARPIRFEISAELIADENRFIGGLHILTAEQNVVIPVPEGAARSKLLKRISTLKPRPDASEEDFRREWKIHGEYVRKMPGVSAYRQNVVVGRERVKGEPCGYDDLLEASGFRRLLNCRIQVQSSCRPILRINGPHRSFSDRM